MESGSAGLMNSRMRTKITMVVRTDFQLMLGIVLPSNGKHRENYLPVLLRTGSNGRDLTDTHSTISSTVDFAPNL